MKKRVPYTCIRCGYHSSQKNDMRKHLYQKKIQCQKLVNDIILSDEIKESILLDRIYHLPKVTEQQVMNQTINNYNTMNNFLNGIEPMKKLGEYLKYTNTNTIPFERSIELMYEKQRLKLEKGQGYHHMDTDHLFEVIDSLTGVESKNMEDFNFFFDHEVNRLNMFESGEWKELYVTSGLKKVINMIQDYFWHTYECYLIKKIQTTLNFIEKQKFRELLVEYYSFLASLDVDPYVKDTPNNKINYTGDDDEFWTAPSVNDVEAYSLSHEFMKLYNQTRDDMTMRKREKLKQDLKDLLKRNSKRNAQELNKVIMSLINVDTEFKQDMLQLTT
jgi:hypothetical protein